MTDDFNDDDLNPTSEQNPVPQTGFRVEEFHPAKWNSQQLQPADWKGTPFENARERDGSLTTEVTENTLVRINGVQMPAMRAAELGFFDVGDDGKLLVISPEQREANQQQQEADRRAVEQAELAKELPPLETVDRDAANAADQVAAIASESSIPLEAIVSEYLVHQTVNKNFLRAAVRSGVDDPKGMLETVADGAAKQGAAVLAANGVVDIEHCLSWVQKSVSSSDRVRADMRLLAGDPAGYRSIAERYKQFAPVSGSPSGVELFEHRGRQFVRFPNGDVTSATAARSKGLI